MGVGDAGCMERDKWRALLGDGRSLYCAINCVSMITSLCSISIWLSFPRAAGYLWLIAVENTCSDVSVLYTRQMAACAKNDFLN